MKPGKKEAREAVKALEARGWVFMGVRAGHLRLEHQCGAKLTISGTPSDHRSRKNELARATRRVREAMAQR